MFLFHGNDKQVAGAVERPGGIERELRLLQQLKEPRMPGREVIVEGWWHEAAQGAELHQRIALTKGFPDACR